MSDEGKDEVEKIQLGEDGKIPADKEGKYPEVVPYHKYVGIKEKFTRVEKELKDQVSSLEERLNKAPNAEEFIKSQKELGDLKAEHQKVTDELKGIKDKSVSELRETLKSKGVSEEDISGLGETELRVLTKAVVGFKPKPDLGGGGGSSGLKGTPMQLAQQAYSK